MRLTDLTRPAIFAETRCCWKKSLYRLLKKIDVDYTDILLGPGNTKCTSDQAMLEKL